MSTAEIDAERLRWRKRFAEKCGEKAKVEKERNALRSQLDEAVGLLTRLAKSREPKPTNYETDMHTLYVTTCLFLSRLDAAKDRPVCGYCQAFEDQCQCPTRGPAFYAAKGTR